MGARKQVDAPPAEFAEALTQLREARFRPEVFVEEMPAPQRIAPHAAAVSADVTVDGDDVATGRIGRPLRPGRERRLAVDLPLCRVCALPSNRRW